MKNELLLIPKKTDTERDSQDLPQTYVLDVGFNPQAGWFIIEFNTTWGAGLNGCDPQIILDCKHSATIQLAQ